MEAPPKRTAADLRREYVYHGLAASHAGTYLWPSVFDLLPPAPARVCEIGCGNGALAEQLAKRGYDVLAFDSSESGIALAKSRGTTARFEVANISQEPPPKWIGSFDAVISLEVIEHLLLPRELARFARAVLRPSGRLVLSTPYHGYVKNLLIAVSGRSDAHFGALWDHGHVKFFSERSLGTLLEEQAFVEITFRHCGRVPFLWKSMIAVCRKPANE